MSIDKWNYKDLGFDSLEEMNESIERVKAEERLTPHELAQKKYTKTSTINEHGEIDFLALEDGVRQARLDAAVKSKLMNDKASQVTEAENRANEKLMTKLSDFVENNNRQLAEAEFNEQKEKIEAELQKEIYRKHNVNTSYQDTLDNSYRSLLGGIKNKE